MMVGLCTRIVRLRASMDDILFLGEEKVQNVREIVFANSVYPLKRNLGFNLL
jgi:hypothetical protein